MEKDRQFKIGEVLFELVAIPPMRQWEISETIREAVGQPEVLAAGAVGTSPTALMMAVLAGLKKENVLEIRNALFEFVMFKAKDQLKALQLMGAEDMAFVDLDFTAVYEVMGRSFYVNFTGSLSGMMSRIGFDLKDLAVNSDSPPSDVGASPNSSQNQ